LAKPYLNSVVKKVLSAVVEKYEAYACGKFDFIVAATPYISDKFLAYTKSVDINNYPIIEELFNSVSWNKRKNQVCYVGVIAKIRGNLENVQAMVYVNENVTFKLAGMCYEEAFFDILESNDNWERVDFVGKLDREGVKNLLQESKIGLVTLHPTVNYKDALPVKMFEYMVAGIPVIASDFPTLREIVEKERCGICVDPLNAKSIGEAIEHLSVNDHLAEMMGENGKRAVLEKYNWAKEEQKLFEMYKKVLNG